ncbi:phospholipase-D-like [Vaccinia virus]|uniref:DNA nicking-joining enzyme n=3 Tax=Vaccinia virus TaxID=10245 RepID=O57172_VACCA|nr:phospholipase D-like protein [Vaccinia virus]ABZ79943.1 phospholipase-D-like protein [synthetic Vaccinia virus]QOS44559.1 MVA025L [synthetic construct]WPR21522.1 phospholipase-D-like [Vaccinia virus Lister]CAM58205.1 DNA nicking-joining enzyme [Vaccinia virus Ankara]
MNPDNTIAVITETIPIGMQFDKVYLSTFNMWREILSNTTKTLDISSFYWSLSDEVGTNFGTIILNEIVQLPKRGVRVRVAVNKSNKPLKDVERLQMAGVEVRYIDITNILGGVLHTKFWISDNTHIYLGSANMDWRSLTQVKELGIAIFNNRNLAADLTQIFEVYWYLGVNNLPYNWKNFYPSYYNTDHPLSINVSGVPHSVFIASAPQQLCTMERTNDLTALLSCIRNASKFVYVSVMNFIPIIYSKAGKILFWPYIEDELRRSAIDRQVSVKLLISCWQRSSFIMRNFLRSIAMLKSKNINIEVKLFIVPDADPPIPYSRVNHAKYMVTDKTAYIGTSNWTGNYFTDTCGASINITPDDGLGLRQQLEDIFMRDWNSKYSYELYDTSPTKRCKLLKNMKQCTNDIYCDEIQPEKEIPEYSLE